MLCRDMRIYLLSWLTLVGQSISTCGPRPLSIPIADVPLPNGHARRGILGTVGTPAQNISFMVHSYLNDTWIYNSTEAFCGSQTIDQCLTFRGGLYETDPSSSYVYQDDVYAAGGDPSDVARTLGTHIWSSAWASDTLEVGNASLADYPIGMPGFDFGEKFDGQANFGLGQNSSLLQRLKDGGHIASRSWSYWWGVENALSRSAMDGHLIIGGYDAAKTSGTPFTQPLHSPSEACSSGMTLSISNLLLNFPNGTSSDLNPSTILTACLQPNFPSIMTIPADPYWWRYQEVTGTRFTNKSLGTNWFVPVFPSSGVYAGGLDIQIQGGPAITIPNDVLTVPNEYIDTSGAVRRNDSAADVLFSPIDDNNSNDQLIIGKQFFSGAYLTVNLDEQTWSIWSAKATTDTNITTIGDSCGNVTDATASAPPVVSTSPSADIDTDADSNDIHGLSTGAIAGIAAGCGCAVLALTGIIVFCMTKRHQRKKKAVAHPDPVGSVKSSGFSSYDATPFNYVPQEMPGSQTLPYELRSNEKPVELFQDDQRGMKWGNTRHHAVELPACRY